MSKIEDLIKASLEELILIGSENGGIANATKKLSSRIIFPQYFVGNHTGHRRVSEQEARFLFTRELEKQKDFYYSIEAPTKKAFRFSVNGQIINPNIAPTGQSASIDVCIYNNKYTRQHLIEFKALNPNQESFNKDFLKLFCDEDNLQNYFVHIIETYDKGTIDSLLKKYKTAFDFVSDSYSGKKSTVEVCLCILSFKPKYQMNSGQAILFFTKDNYNDKLNSLLITN
jgi:hypothetical protein